MTDEAPERDTPEAAAAAPVDEGTPAPQEAESDWESRFKEAQAWGTRASQEAAEYREIIDLARAGDPETLEFLGWEVPEEEVDEDADEPLTRAEFVEYLRERDEAAREQQDYEMQLDSEANLITSTIANFEKENGDLDQDEYDAIVDIAISRRTDDGNPDIQGAIKQVTGLKDHYIKSYVDNKKRAPQAPAPGSAPDHQPDLDDREERRNFMLQRMASLEE